MASLNKVIIMGNLTRDPELKYTPNGTAVAELGLAMNRRYKDGNGVAKEDTTFVDLTLWGRTAEIANEYLRKGDSALIEGRLTLDQWDDKQTGQKRSKLRVTGEQLTMLGQKPQREQSQEQPHEQPPSDPDASPFSGGSRDLGF